MASYFGEITDLSSRAVKDEDFDCIPSLPDIETKLFTADSGKIDVDLILFAVGKIAVAFVDNYFISNSFDQIASLEMKATTSEDETFSGLVYSTKPKTLAKIFINSKNMVCEILDNVPEELSNSLFDKVLDLCRTFQRAVVLSTYHSSVYKSNDSISTESFLRSLTTSHYLAKYSKPGISSVKAPNIISGFPAAVMAECEITKKEAVLFACYTDSAAFDTVTVRSFAPVLNNILVGQIPVNDNVDIKLMDYFRGKQIQSNNLYI